MMTVSGPVTRGVPQAASAALLPVGENKRRMNPFENNELTINRFMAKEAPISLICHSERSEESVRLLKNQDSSPPRPQFPATAPGVALPSHIRVGRRRGTTSSAAVPDAALPPPSMESCIHAVVTAVRNDSNKLDQSLLNANLAKGLSAIRPKVFVPTTAFPILTDTCDGI